MQRKTWHWFCLGSIRRLVEQLWDTYNKFYYQVENDSYRRSALEVERDITSSLEGGFQRDRNQEEGHAWRKGHLNWVWKGAACAAVHGEASEPWSYLASILIRLGSSKLQSFTQATRSGILDKESQFLWVECRVDHCKNRACLCKTTTCHLREKPCTIYRNKKWEREYYFRFLIRIASTTEHLPCFENCLNFFANSLNSHNGSVKWALLLASFNGWRNWDTERVRNVSQIAELVRVITRKRSHSQL